MLRKIGRFAAARLQGSKGKRKYDDWMKRNPWASTALTVGDIALAGYAAPKAMAGLKGLLTGGKAAGAASAAAQPQMLGQLASADPVQAAQMSARMMAQPAAKATMAGAKPAGGSSLLRRAGKMAGGVARSAGGFVRENPLATSMALEGLLTGSQNAQQMRMEREQWRQQQEQQQFLAQLLAPLFMQYYRGQ